MNIKRVTANLPQELLERAQAVSGEGITETLIKGLELVCRAEAITLARKLKGKISLEMDGGRKNGRSRS